MTIKNELKMQRHDASSFYAVTSSNLKLRDWCLAAEELLFLFISNKFN